MKTQEPKIAHAEALPLPSILPLQAYKPFHSQASRSRTKAGQARKTARQVQEKAGWRDLVERRASISSWGPSRSVSDLRYSEAREWQAYPTASRSAPIRPGMLLQERVAAFESQGFLRAKVVAKEQLCSQVIGENQQLLRQLEESETLHRQAIDRVKLEASAVVQHLLDDTAVLRSTHENLLRKLELQERQASRDALRAHQAERDRQEAEEKLLVLKRFVAGLQEKQKTLEQKAHAFIIAFRSVKSAIRTFAASLATCNFSAEDKEALKQLPEMLSLAINRMQLVLSEAEARLLEKGFAEEVSAREILKSSTSAKPESMVPATDATRLQKERNMWENKYVKVERELRAKAKELESVKKENARKADVLLKLRLKDHRLKLQEAEFCAAKAKNHDLQSQLEELVKDRDKLAAWKASHPLYKGYRWDKMPDQNNASASGLPSKTKPSMNDPAKEGSTLKSQQLKGVFKSSPSTGLARSASRSSVASSRRVSPVTSAAQPSRVSRDVHSSQVLGTAPAGRHSSKGRSLSTAVLSDAKTDGKPPEVAGNSQPQVDVAGMTLLKRDRRSSVHASGSTQIAKSLSASTPTLALVRGGSVTHAEESKPPSRAPSAGETAHRLTLELPGSHRSLASPRSMRGVDEKPDEVVPPSSAVGGPKVTSDTNRLAAFFSTAFSKAAAKERRQVGHPNDQRQETEANLSPRKGRLEQKSGPSHLPRVGSTASIRTLGSGGRRIHIDFQNAPDKDSVDKRPSLVDAQILSPRSDLARAQAIAFMEGSDPDTSRFSGRLQVAEGAPVVSPHSADTQPPRTHRGHAKVTVALEESREAATPSVSKPKGFPATQKKSSKESSVGRTVELAKRVSLDGSSLPHEASSLPPSSKEEPPAKDMGRNAAAAPTTAGVEDVLEKYLGTQGRHVAGVQKLEPSQNDGVTLQDKRHKAEAKQRQLATDGGTGGQRQLSYAKQSEIRAQDGVAKPHEALRKQTPAPPKTKQISVQPLEDRGSTEPLRDSQRLHVTSPEDEISDKPIVRLGTRAGRDGSPSRLIAGIRKAPPRLMEKNVTVEPRSEAVVSQHESKNAGSEAAVAVLPPVNSTMSVTMGKSKSPLLSADNVGSVTPPPALASASAGNISILHPEVEGGTPRDGGHQRKRLSVGDVAAGSWAMAAPKLNISAVKATVHLDQGVED